MNLKLWLPKWSGHKMAWWHKDTIGEYDPADDGPEVDIIRLLTKEKPNEVRTNRRGSTTPHV